MPKPIIRKSIAITFKTLKHIVNFSRKPRLTRSTICSSPLNSALGAKSAMRFCTVGCVVLDLHIKKLTDAEGDEKAQERFARQIKRLEKYVGTERILYMDEAGMLARDIYRWGWSERGRRKYGLQRGKGREGLILLLGKQGGFIEPLVFEGGCTREVVESWLEALVGQRQPHVLMMDNAAFHKGGRVKEILRKAHCLLL